MIIFFLGGGGGGRVSRLRSEQRYGDSTSLEDICRKFEVHFEIWLASPEITV